MAAPFSVNLVIGAGIDFNQQFTLTNADKSPIDITGYTFYGNLSKTERAINAVLSTSTDPVYVRTPFTTTIVNGTGGVYSISLTADQTRALQLGKYVYDVVMRDLNGELLQAVSGLAFVDVAFGAPIPAVTPPSTTTPTNYP